jgi:hypothetical protein
MFKKCSFLMAYSTIDEDLTPRWISPIAATSYLLRALKEKKNGIPDDLSEISRLVARERLELSTSAL